MKSILPPGGAVPETAAWIEILIALVLLLGAVYPLSGLCSGRALGLDCESRAIFGVNVLAPLAVLLLACGVWALRTRAIRSQLALALGIGALILYWVSAAL